MTVAQLKKGEAGIITDTSSQGIPIKLKEMGCLPGNTVRLLHIAPLTDPLCLDINGSLLAIRKETAALIKIERI